MVPGQPIVTARQCLQTPLQLLGSCLFHPDNILHNTTAFRNQQWKAAKHTLWRKLALATHNFNQTDDLKFDHFFALTRTDKMRNAVLITDNRDIFWFYTQVQMKPTSGSSVLLVALFTSTSGVLPRPFLRTEANSVGFCTAHKHDYRQTNSINKQQVHPQANVLHPCKKSVFFRVCG